MKILYLVINNIKNFITVQMRIFITMYLGLIITCSSLLFLYSLTVGERKEYEENFGYKQKTYTILLNQNNDLHKKNKLIEQLLDGSNLPPVSQILLITNNYSERINQVVGILSHRQIFYNEEGRFFNQDDQTNSKEVIIPWVGFFDYGKGLSHIGDEFFVEDTGYKIVGVASGCPNKTIYIPLKTYLNKKFRIDYVSITFSKQLNSVTEKFFIDLIKGLIPNAKIENPPPVDKTELNQFLTGLLIIILMVTLSIINIITLYNFWIRSNIRLYYIYIICGATKKLIYTIIGIEAALLSISSFMIALIVFLSINPLLINTGISLQVRIIDILVCLVIILISIFISVINILRKIGKSLDSCKIKLGGD